MTTAHRPTWHTAKGGTEQGGNVLINPSRGYSAKDLPAHKTLKERQDVGAADLTVDQFRRELLEREKGIKKEGDDETRQNDPILMVG